MGLLYAVRKERRPDNCRDFSNRKMIWKSDIEGFGIMADDYNKALHQRVPKRKYLLFNEPHFAAQLAEISR